VEYGSGSRYVDEIKLPDKVKSKYSGYATHTLIVTTPFMALEQMLITELALAMIVQFEFLEDIIILVLKCYFFMMLLLMVNVGSDFI